MFLFCSLSELVVVAVVVCFVVALRCHDQANGSRGEVVDFPPGHGGDEQPVVAAVQVDGFALGAIVEVDVEDNVILVKGAVPGPNGGYVVLRRSKR